ncbi:sulfite exporter TauE/SafE family protein [Pseudoclavibacter sp. RFBB5]|nr:sulfite exporter TauE/SafE family protein [Pseudoclavibacter sp. Marseille-Q4354]PPG30720.1 sulfite exporter TauE/SafE family protein [Pseudoclavibacter sp. RFBB5]
MTGVTTRRSPGGWAWLVVTGLLAGFLSGLFGVGGGILIVPALIYLVRLDPRLAAGTSLLAILPSAIVGVVTYAIGGHVDLLLALLLAAGAIVGAPIGSWLLQKVSKRTLQWSFIAFIVVVIISLFLVVPSRDAAVHIDVLGGVLLVVLGLCTGVLSGLLGIGGGVVVVPMLVVLFGSSDLLAKGSSLLMMIPTAISGTISNLRRKNVDVGAGLAVGGSACLTTTLGGLSAAAISPSLANILFAVFLAATAIRMGIDAWPRRRAQ